MINIIGDLETINITNSGKYCEKTAQSSLT